MTIGVFFVVLVAFDARTIVLLSKIPFIAMFFFDFPKLQERKIRIALERVLFGKGDEEGRGVRRREREKESNM